MEGSRGGLPGASREVPGGLPGGLSGGPWGSPGGSREGLGALLEGSRGGPQGNPGGYWEGLGRGLVCFKSCYFLGIWPSENEGGGAATPVFPMCLIPVWRAPGGLPRTSREGPGGLPGGTRGSRGGPWGTGTPRDPPGHPPRLRRDPPGLPRRPPRRLQEHPGQPQDSTHSLFSKCF